jgi:selenocysteine lyase/cysteine desulfurase
LDKEKIGFVVAEHVSNISVILPIKEIVAACREKQIICVVDGNHGFGNIEVNINDIDPGILRSENEI